MTTTPYTRLVTNVSQLKGLKSNCSRTTERSLPSGSLMPTVRLHPLWIRVCTHRRLSGNVLPGFHQTCTIRADLSKLYSTGVPQVGAGGVTYYEIK